MTITKTININTSPDKVWDYVNNLSNWPEWAIHNITDSNKGDDEYWLMKGPRGVSKVKMYSNKVFGILDHEFIDPSEGSWLVPCRVIAGHEGAHFMISFTKPAQMPNEAFKMAMKLLDEELLALKQIIEE